MSKAAIHNPMVNIPECIWFQLVWLAVVAFMLVSCRSETTHPQPVPPPGSTLEAATEPPGLGTTAIPSSHATLTAPTPRPTVLSNPCSPPCWFDFIPGQTDFAQAMDRIGSLLFVSDHWISEAGRRAQINWTSGTLNPEPPGFEGHIRIQNGLVTEIYVHRPRPLRTADEIVQLFGIPETVRPLAYGAEEYFFEVTFLYPQQGVAFTASGTVDIRGLCLDADSAVIWEQYYIPGTFDEYLDRHFPSQTDRDRYKGECVPWPGFGCSGFLGE